MSVLGRLAFILTADASKMKRELSRAESSVAQLKVTLKGLGKMIGSVFAILAVKNFIKASIEAADQQVKAQAALYQALKGNEKGYKELITEADKLARITLFEDEDINKAQAMLAMYGLTTDQIKKATPVVLDFATALGGDLSEAARRVGMTLSTSAKNIRGVGVEVEGAKGSAQKLDSILTELNKKFGGQAMMAARSGFGSFQMLQKAFGEIREEIGMKLMPVVVNMANWLNDNLVPLITKVIDKFASWSEYSARNTMQWKKMGAAMQFFADSVKMGPVQAYTLMAARTAQAEAEFTTFVASIKNKRSELDKLLVLGTFQEGEKKKGGGGGKATLKPGAAPSLVGSSITAGSLKMSEMAPVLAENTRYMENYGMAMAAAAHNAKLLEDQLLKTELAQIGLSAVTDLFNTIAQSAGMAEMERAEAIREASHRIVSALIAQGVTSVITSTLQKMSFTGPLAIPIAAAAGAGAQALFNSMIPKFATGGIVPGGFPNDTYPAMLSSGETVIPKPKKLGAHGGGDVNVRGVIFGDNLLIVNQRSNTRYNRVRGY